MADWAFDAARYIEDVVKPVQRGWPPTRNLFRVYQLSITASQSEVDIALAEMPHCWGRPELRAYGSGCERLRACHEGAAALLRDGDRRAAHRRAVEEDLRRLADVVRHRLHGAPAMPARAIDELVRASAYWWTRPDVLAALAMVGAKECEPAELPDAAEPKRWKQLRECLADLPYRHLWDYLTCAPGLAGVETAEVEIEARRRRLRVARDRAATAETTLLALVRRWLAEPGGLSAVLCHELLTELAGECLYGYAAVRATAADPDRCAAARLPTAPDVLAYAVWCARAGVPPRWVADYDNAVADRRLTEALAVLDAHPLPGEWFAVRDDLRATVDRLTAELESARELEESSVEDAAAVYLAVWRELSAPDIVDGLLRCPAAAPSEVSVGVQVGGEKVLVRWTASPSTAGWISYRVTRGTTVVAGHTTELTVIDAPAIATPVVYTVTTFRNGVPGGAADSPEVTVLPDVTDLVVSPAIGVIEGRWRMPELASGVRVVRTSPGETNVVVLTGRREESFADHRVEPETLYTYWVWARYPTGYSPGVTVRVKSAGVRCPVTDLRAELNESTVDLSWTSRSKGHTEFRVLAQGTVPPSGAVPVARAATVGPLVGYADSSPARIDLADLAGERVLVPVTVSGAWAVVGDAVTVEVPLPPVEGLRAEQFGPQVRLSWEWPAWAQDARVLWWDVEPKDPADPRVSWFDTTRLAYLSRGVRVHVDGPGEYRFGVRVLDRGRLGPLRTVSLRSRPEVIYTVHKVPWFRYGTHVVSVRGSGPLPEVAVVAKSGTRPLAIDDGCELLRLPGGAVTTVTETLSVPGRLARPVHLRAFALDERVLLRHPDPRDLVVG